jgi:hypothetical protein
VFKDFPFGTNVDYETLNQNNRRERERERESMCVRFASGIFELLNRIAAHDA